ncbi:N-formylglutamate amidohydrolase [Aliifodinibius sp. S!AR15-10]|uniref:N-formylglutamate amidohydrolase n=1 Tax=Aliifodinibius sp. S!AR15-10 TaxID=2950437 RepID=UPI00285F71B2|nr:N-formylglutamate amidohydrolase [Aliifodinibius sp. S!AR15-10]MDR8391660.1 N-formylglutamate amidohydrolase [Aliifodinibius sp. S!AR15-10]
MANQIIITCEHAGNSVPAPYRKLFDNNPGILNTHRGYDIGAFGLAKKCAQRLNVTPFVHHITRLLVDLNRSPNSNELFSEYTRSLDEETKESVLNTYYQPHRTRVEQKIGDLIAEGERVLHLSVHTFTPELNGAIREADIGLLFDPERPEEKRFCEAWKSLLKKKTDLNILFNTPYPGVMDGFTTYLRTKYKVTEYVGLEIEVNQKFPQSNDIGDWEQVQILIADTLYQTYKEWS